MNLIKAAEILIEKIKTDYTDDVAVVVMMGSHLYGETHRLSDLDMYFVVNTPRGYELGKTFIIDGIGFDFWPIGWERMERIANHEERITAIITEGQILYYSTDRDLERFNALKTKALDTQNTKKFLNQAKKVLSSAYQSHFHMNRYDDLTTVRKKALSIVFSVTNAIALINSDTVKRGRGKLKGELLAMKHVPEDFEKDYDVLFESLDIEKIKSSMSSLLLNTSNLLESQVVEYERNHPESVKDRLAGFYEELINFYNKIERGLEVGDFVTVFYAANEIVAELEDVFNGTGVSLNDLPDIVGAYGRIENDAYGILVKNHQQKLEALLNHYGVDVTVYADFEAMKANL